MSSQTVGVVLIAVAAALLWSLWALVVAGVMLLVVPEVVSLAAARRAARRDR